jgi:hypothetical protein
MGENLTYSDTVALTERKAQILEEMKTLLAKPTLSTENIVTFQTALNAYNDLSLSGTVTSPLEFLRKIEERGFQATDAVRKEIGMLEPESEFGPKIPLSERN